MRIIFKNARLFTATSNHHPSPSETPTCLIINHNLIEYIGPSSSPFVETAESQGGTIRDMQSLTITPGFIDGHMHLLLFGSDLLKIHLDDCTSLNDIRSTIRQGAEERPSAKRLFCSGWMHSMTDGQAQATMLDDIDPQERPIFINSKDLHSAWCNSAALQEMAMQDAPDPEGGKIHRDPHGNPSGLLEEAATLKIVWPHTAKVTSREENLRSIREAIKAYNAAGYTGVIELATDEEIWSLMKQIREEQDEVSLRFAAHWLITPSKTTAENLAQVDRAIALHEEYNLTTSADFRIAGIKIICDGVIDACTAALREPYTSTATNSEPIWSASQLQPVVEKANKAGLQIALHAIGDAAVTLAVNALERCSKNRHRIEHLELTSPADSKRLGELGITASIQPVHSDPSILLAWPSLLGPDRCTRAFAYQEFLANGAPLAIGTDSPTAPHLPLSNLYVATTRKSARQPHACLAPVNEHFKLSFENALTAATRGSAYACFAEQRVGSLEVGKLADFVVLDLQGGDESDLLRAEVKETWFGGRRVFPR